jgi:hypothetical protein
MKKKQPEELIKKIVINHLGYIIYVKDVNLGQHKDRFEMWTQKLDGCSCELYTYRKIALRDTPTIAHEVMHVLQYIAEDRGIDMSEERENMAYLMQYIMSQIMGMKYIMGVVYPQ